MAAEECGVGGIGRCSAKAAAAAAAAAREREREREREARGDGEQGKRKQPASKKAKVAKKAKVGKAAACGTGRDLAMGTFHTLGKLLYNKRLPEPEAGAHGGSGSSRCVRACVGLCPCPCVLPSGIITVVDKGGTRVCVWLLCCARGVASAIVFTTG